MGTKKQTTDIEIEEYKDCEICDNIATTNQSRFCGNCATAYLLGQEESSKYNSQNR